AECMSCSNLPLEFRLMQEKLPHVKTLLIGSGANVATFRPIFEKLRIQASALVDEQRSVIGAFHMTAEPVVFLMDASGHVLYIDTRSAPQAATYPMGRLLTELRATLSRPDSLK